MRFVKDIKEYHDFSSVHQISLYIPSNLATKQEAEDLLKELYEKYQKILVLATIKYTKLPSYNKVDKNGKLISIQRVETIKKFQGFKELSSTLRNWLRYPSRAMTINVFGIENINYTFCYTSKFVNRLGKKQRPIQKDLFDYLFEHKLITLIPDESKAYSKTYEFTDKYYTCFNRYLPIIVTEPHITKLYEQYKKEGLDQMLLRDHNKIMKRIETAHIRVKPKRDYSRFIRMSRRSAFSDLEDDLE